MARYLFTLSIPLVLLVQAFALQVPSYIKICGRRDPELDKCVIDSIEKLKPKLRTGIKELTVPAMEPLDVERVPLAELPSFKAIANDVKISGVSGFKMIYLKVDLENEKIDFEVTIPKVVMQADYDVEARILVPIQDKGPISTISRNVFAKIGLKFKKVQHRGQTHMYFTNIQMKLELKDFEATFQPIKQSPVSDAINSVLINSKDEIIESMTPNLEKAISTKIIEVANRICKNFTYDDLFPDRV